MKEVTMTFTKEELELLFELACDYTDNNGTENDYELTKFHKIFNLGLRLKHQLEKMNEKCKLIDICNCKTGVCNSLLPNDGCPYYRYFKNLIEENEGK